MYGKACFHTHDIHLRLCYHLFDVFSMPVVMMIILDVDHRFERIDHMNGGSYYYYYFREMKTKGNNCAFDLENLFASLMIVFHLKQKTLTLKNPR